MRTTEWIQLSFAILFTIAAWTTALTSRPLPMRHRWIVTVLAAIAAIVLAATHAIRPHISANAYAILLDCVTVTLFLIPYWQTGQFFLGPDEKKQATLLAMDRRLLPRISAAAGTRRNLIGAALEMAYLSCYPLVPLGLAAVYLFGLRSHVEGFWLVLMLGTYICYALTPLVPAYPPRSLITSAPTKKGETGKTRLFNLFLLKHGSIHAISFPSAHVASAFAIAFVLLYYSPPVGFAFLIIAIMISLGAVIGRYHYAIDVILGAATALLVFLACRPWL
jgi:membrane-associated phospholipid phosphatase